MMNDTPRRLDNVQAVVFDFDGVIAKCKNGDPFRRLGERRSASEPPFMAEIYRLLENGKPIGSDWVNELREEGIDVTPEMNNYLSRRMFFISRGDWVIYSWAGQIIPVLAKRVRLAICSNNSRKNIKFVLGRLLKHFSCVITYEDVCALKPDPEGLILISKELDVSLSNILLIGDSVEDEFAALNAGTLFALADWGRERPPIIREDTTLHLSSPEFLLELIWGKE